MDLQLILAEPVVHNTVPCIVWTCWSICKEEANANVTPTDAIAINREEFRCVIKNALIYTEKNNDIVTISIKPSCLETSYGYAESSSGRRRFIA